MRLLVLLKKNLHSGNFTRFFFLVIYMIFCKHLPKSTSFFLGKLSKQLRYQCCKRIFKYCGENVNVERGATFGSGFSLEIGNNSGLGINCNVPSNIVIGENVMMGPECFILSSNHNFQSVEIPMVMQGHVEKKKTTIEDDVWIGRQVLFTPGRTVRKGSIIGAGCVLTKDFEEYSIIGGNPSKLIRSRKGC